MNDQPTPLKAVAAPDRSSPAHRPTSLFTDGAIQQFSRSNAQPSQAGAAEPGREFPSAYEPLSRVHHGAYTEIWKAQHRYTGQLLAIKRLHSGWQDDPISLVLLQHECSAAGRVDSRYVTRVLDADLDCPRPFVVTEWIAGTTLEEQLQDNGPLSAPCMLWIARQCVSGMYDLERAGFAHGDIRPANVMRVESGECKLIGLAHAKLILPEDGLPRSNFLIGCTDYIAPECFLDGTPHPIITDLYGLGLTLFKLLSGRLPFAATSAMDLMRQKRDAEAPSIGELRGDIPRELIDLVDSLLSKRPIQRPGSLKSLARQLVSLELVTQRRQTYAIKTA